MIALHSNPAHYQKVQQIRNDIKLDSINNSMNTKKGWHRWCSIFSDDGMHQGVQVAVNPVYTNPAVYKTVFPMLTGLLVCLNGLWWWQMAFSFYVWPAPQEMENGHHAITKAYETLFFHMAALVAIWIALSLIRRFLDRNNNNCTTDLEMNPIPVDSPSSLADQGDEKSSHYSDLKY
jgi:hypothetical protein